MESKLSVKWLFFFARERERARQNGRERSVLFRRFALSSELKWATKAKLKLTQIQRVYRYAPSVRVRVCVCNH